MKVPFALLGSLNRWIVVSALLIATAACSPKKEVVNGGTVDPGIFCTNCESKAKQLTYYLNVHRPEILEEFSFRIDDGKHIATTVEFFKKSDPYARCAVAFVARENECPRVGPSPTPTPTPSPSATPNASPTPDAGAQGKNALTAATSEVRPCLEDADPYATIELTACDIVDGEANIGFEGSVLHLNKDEWSVFLEESRKQSLLPEE